MIDLSRYIITTYEIFPYHIVIFQNASGDLLNILVDLELELIDG